MATTPRASSIHVCNPKTPQHRNAMLWLTSLAEVTKGKTRNLEQKKSMQQSLQLYRMFAETGERSYLELSENFLKRSFRVTESQRKTC